MLAILTLLGGRLRAGLRPRLAVAAAAAGISVLAAPLLAIAILLGFGLAVGTRLSQSVTGALAWAASVVVLIALIAVADLLVGVLTVARIESGARLGAAFAGALRTLPRLVVALLAVLVAMLVLLLAGPVVVVAALVVAAVLRLRRRPGVRRALVAAIPLLPVVAALVMLPATLAAANEGPGSVRELLRAAWEIVRRRARMLAAFVISTAALSALLSWAGSAASAALDGAGQADASLLVVALALLALILVVGTVLALCFPPRSPVARARRVRAPRKRMLSRVATLVTVSVIASILPTVSIAPVFADTVLAPVLSNGIDGAGPSPLLSAEVSVPDGDPSGSVQFYDGTIALGSPVPVIRSSFDPTQGTVRLTNKPVLDPGQHEFSFAFTPDSTLVASGNSDPQPWHFTATTDMTITADPSAAVGGPADITVTVAADYATSVTPAGTVHVEWDGGSADPTLTGGVARLTIPELTSPEVDASYAGSVDFTAVSSSIQVGEVVTPQDTVITASLADVPYPLGSTLVAFVSVAAPGADFGTVVRGVVQVYSGSTLLAEDTAFRDNSSILIPTGALNAGPVDLRFEFVPASGFAASETTVSTTLTAATTTVQATLSSARTSWGNPLHLVVAVTSSLDGSRTVELRDTLTDSVVATQDVVLSGGTGTTSIDLAASLRPGDYSLVATVLGDSDHAAAVSGSSSVFVDSAATSTALTVSPNPAEIGQPVTVTAVTTSTAGLPDAVAGTITLRMPDGTQEMLDVTDGSASMTWTPTEQTTGDVTASFFDTGFLFAGSSAHQAITVTSVVAPVPTVNWTGALTPADRTVTLSYSAASGHDLPTGVVRILNASDGILANALLVGGVVTMRVDGTTGAHPALRAVYLGDDVYGTRSDVVPVDTLTNYLPTVTVTPPSTAVLGTPFPVAVGVADVPLGLVQTVTITDTAPGGAVTSLGTVTLDGAGNASTSVTLLLEGTHQLGATVTFSPASELADVAAAHAPVVVAPVPVPALVVSSPTDSSGLVAGGALDLDVTAGWIGTGTTGVPAGTTAEVLDNTNTVLGTVTLLGATGVNGYRGRLHLTNLHGGTLSVHAVVVYGPLSATVSSPVLDLVVAAPVTVLTVQAESVVVGSPMPVTVDAYPSGGFAGLSRSLPATVVVGGADYPLTLSRSSATGFFSGSVDVPTAHAGTLTIDASIVGDGTDTGAASAENYSTVDRRATSIVSQVVEGSAAGQDLILSADIVQAGESTSPIPTGAITILSDLNEARCTIASGQQCTIPGTLVRDGANTFTTYYDGDADNLPATGTASFTAGARTSSLSVSYSPAPGSWVFGDPVTATWTTTTSGRTAAGSVVITIAGARCSGPAAAGSCTVTPRTIATSGQVDSSYGAVFAPSDDAPAAQSVGETSIYLCVYPTFLGTVDYSRAVRCGTAGAGIRTDSLVTLSATPAANYVVDHWTFGDQTILGATPEVRIETSGIYRSVQRYAPACFTLTISPLLAARATNGGYLTTTTVPNCSDPRNPSAGDLADLAAGHPRYAAGTAVGVDVYPNYGGPGLVVDALSGLTLLNDSFGSLLMDRDRTVTATFKVKACVPVSIVAAEGGTVALTKAVRPDSTASLTPATGACTAAGGSAGYVPGTTLTYTATPGSGASLDSWTVSTGYPGIVPADVALAAESSLPPSSIVKSLTQTVVVPAVNAVQVAARFAMVKCVSVTIVSRTIVGYWDTTGWSAPRGATGTPYDTQGTCGGIAGTHSVKISGSGWYEITTDTVSYVATGRIDVGTAQKSYRPNPIRNVQGSAYVTWDTSSGLGVKRLAYTSAPSGYTDVAGMAAGSTFADSGMDLGPSIDLTAAPPAITVDANWVLEAPTECFAPHIALPQGGSYILNPASPDEPFCETPGLVANGEKMTLRAANPIGAPALTPMLTTVSNGIGATMPAAFVGSGNYMLEYCAPLALDVRIHDDSGHVTTATADQATELFDDDGGCPPGWTRPNRVTRTGLTSGGATNYTVIGNADGFGPTLAVDPAGVITGSHRVDLQVVCFTLSVYDASITTPGNCPGGAANRFLRGSTVQLQAGSADRFDGWNGVDAQQGETGWVVMAADRSVSADLHNYKWYEKVGNALSSVAERAVAAVVTVATGLLLSETFIAKATGWALTGTAALLRDVGVKGAAIDALDTAGGVISAQFDVVNLLSNCLGSIASGGDTPLLTVPAGSAATPSGGSADDVVAAAKAQLADQLSKAGLNAQVALGRGNIGAMVNIFGSGPSAYSADAASSWSAYGSSLGACTQRGVDQYVATTYGGS